MRITYVNPLTGDLESEEVELTKKCNKPNCNIQLLQVDGIEVEGAIRGYRTWACCRAHAAYRCGNCRGKIHSYTTEVGKKHLKYYVGDLV
jgi:hypothetical protein